MYIKAKKINVLFPETFQYFLGLVGRHFFFSDFFFLYGEKYENHSKYPKIEEKFSDVPKAFRVGPQKVESVGFRETRHFVFLGVKDKDNIVMCFFLYLIFMVMLNF